MRPLSANESPDRRASGSRGFRAFGVAGESVSTISQVAEDADSPRNYLI